MTTTQPLEGTAEATKPGGTIDSADSAAATASTEAAGHGADARRRSWIPGPILPQRFRPTNRPRLWLEVALIALGYYLYTLTRLAAPAHESAAQQRGHDILHFEHYVGLNFEQSVNHWIYSVRWLAFAMNVYYATLHFIVPIAVLIWVYVKFPDRYRTVRTVMIAMTLIALFGFYFYSLAPPRLLHNANFIDTFKLLNPWGQTAATSDGVAGLGSSTNEYAAMPSLHIGWSTWCALVIAHLAQRRWVKALGIAYPLCTFAVIIGTANHYVLDAVFGLVTLALGFLVQRIIQGRSVFAAPLGAAGAGAQGPAGEGAVLAGEGAAVPPVPRQVDGSVGGGPGDGGEGDGGGGGSSELVRPPVRTQA